MSVPTAEEFLKKYENDTDHYADQDYSEFRLIRALQEFAKLHLEACKKEVIDNVETCIGGDGSLLVSISSILNSYPLDNVK